MRRLVAADSLHSRGERKGGRLVVSGGNSDRRMRLPWRTELTQPAGVVHGGAIAALVDSVVVPAIGSGYEERHAFVTIDMQLQYRGAVVREDMVGEGWVTVRGRSIVFCEAEVVTGSGKPVAKAMLTYRVLGPERG
jgi:uncharacterized protein (TIGR00369 family)